jgi:predicted aspartyl protease
MYRRRVQTHGKRREVSAWIDTAFNGGFVLPRRVINELGLVQESSAEATLADGRSVELETYSSFLNGSEKPTKRKSSQMTGNFRCSERCSWRTADLRLITRREP